MMSASTASSAREPNSNWGMMEHCHGDGRRAFPRRDQDERPLPRPWPSIATSGASRRRRTRPQVKARWREIGQPDGTTKPLALEDFPFIAPYNAQVRALQAALPDGARVGSVDKVQGQEAPVCILSLCSSCGEYGSRGLAFILDRNRINVAISRAQCLAVVVADPRIASTAASFH
jgi:superfamily I DNA and/or RNA helicase